MAGQEDSKHAPALPSRQFAALDTEPGTQVSAPLRGLHGDAGGEAQRPQVVNNPNLFRPVGAPTAIRAAKGSNCAFVIPEASQPWNDSIRMDTDP